MTSLMAANAAAFEQTVRSTIVLAGTFDPQDWKRPTDCPGWTVQDVLSHIIGIELMLLGEDPAPGHTLADDGFPHVRNEMGRMMEAAVDARRSHSGDQVLAELREVLDRRLAMLPTVDPDEQTIAPNGRPTTQAGFLGFRAFDAWIHEQDVRRAVGRPGNLDAPATVCTRRIMTPGLPIVVAKRAGAAPGRSVVFEVTGPVEFTERVLVGGDGRAALTDDLDAEPDVRLRMDWETFVRLVAGRCASTDVTVKAAGDAELAERVLANMALTP
ncbi:maleylpyruvate isomerase family mycothiol-dependent enzyme [Actinomadura hibisca]|uniref:maleylpyruvate isomerase family mycothiol-dependent enzyme n=1 Tax=Actinomadura hibisca TaxID=68565 RepID=UPI0008297250|nr:maleylpyruvate isomerase family mycothiol-dependent enzyme [Actinomadura hibisca]